MSYWIYQMSSKMDVLHYSWHRFRGQIIEMSGLKLFLIRISGCAYGNAKLKLYKKFRNSLVYNSL